MGISLAKPKPEEQPEPRPVPTLDHLRDVVSLQRRTDELRAAETQRKVWEQAVQRRAELAAGDAPRYEGEEDDVTETIGRYTSEPPQLPEGAWLAHYRQSVTVFREHVRLGVPGAGDALAEAEQRYANEAARTT